MRRAAFILLCVVFVIILGGCARTVVPEPKEVTFENAMKQVANGLNEMYEIGKDHPKTGLTPAEVTIEFNIAASGTDKGKLTIGGTNPMQTVEAGAEIGSEIHAARGNKITIKFVNMFLTDSKDSLIMLKQPEEIAELLKVLQQSGYQPVIKMTDTAEK